MKTVTLLIYIGSIGWCAQDPRSSDSQRPSSGVVQNGLIAEYRFDSRGGKTVPGNGSGEFDCKFGENTHAPTWITGAWHFQEHSSNI